MKERWRFHSRQWNNGEWYYIWTKDGSTLYCSIHASMLAKEANV